MSNFFNRLAAARVNEYKQSLGALLGIVQGILCDHRLNDQEIVFLERWLASHDAVSTAWPGDVIYAQVREILADGEITDSEREHLLSVLLRLVGDTENDDAPVATLALDDVGGLDFVQRSFCLTGDFVYGDRDKCSDEISQRNGVVLQNVTKKLDYLIVGGLGSTEWKHGKFGTKIEKAMRYKRDGLSILIIHEDQWLKALR